MSCPMEARVILSSETPSFTFMGEAAQQHEAVLVADGHDERAGVAGDARHLGGANAAFARGLAHRSVLGGEGPHDEGGRRDLAGAGGNPRGA